MIDPENIDHESIDRGAEAYWTSMTEDDTSGLEDAALTWGTLPTGERTLITVATIVVIEFAGSNGGIGAIKAARVFWKARRGTYAPLPAWGDLTPHQRRDITQAVQALFVAAHVVEEEFEPPVTLPVVVNEDETVQAPMVVSEGGSHHMDISYMKDGYAIHIGISIPVADDPGTLPNAAAVTLDTAIRTVITRPETTDILDPAPGYVLPPWG